MENEDRRMLASMGVWEECSRVHAPDLAEAVTSCLKDVHIADQETGAALHRLTIILKAFTERFPGEPKLLYVNHNSKKALLNQIDFNCVLFSFSLCERHFGA